MGIMKIKLLQNLVINVTIHVKLALANRKLNAKLVKQLYLNK